MDQAIAKSKYVRLTPRKARLAARLARGLSVKDASFQLHNVNTKGGKLIKKTLDSAVANAETQLDTRREDLKVVEVRVDEGPRMKRAKPKNKGGRHLIIKKTSHITVIVGKE